MKVLFTPITGSSIAHTARSLAVADELRRRGHEIFFTSCAVRENFIRTNGYEVVKVYPTVNLNDTSDQSVNYLKENQSKFVSWFGAETEATKEIKPDLVITAASIFGPHVYYATGTPVVTIMDSQYLDEARGLMGLAMANNTFKDNLITGLLRPIFNMRFTSEYLSEVNEIYKKLGIQTNFKTRHELYNPMAVLIPSDEVFEPLRIARHDTIHIGPLFWDGFERMESDLTDEKIINFKKDKILIYLSFGASVFDSRIYTVVLDELIKTGHKVIVGLGPNWSRDQFMPDSENLLIRTIVPGMRLSKHADIIVNTGSQGAVAQGLTYGKPQIAFPTTMDQSFFANRLEELHIGINVNKVSILKFSKRENFSNFPSEVGERVLKSILLIEGDKKYKQNALVQAEVIRKYINPPSLAADFIEKYSK